ncbi:MAG: TonB-dependent receptor plug domain-containing protein, partial [Oricola sp.]|nr:TonB-dependent receptor plug domain-containing protein [Oricola sp.]
MMNINMRKGVFAFLSTVSAGAMCAAAPALAQDIDLEEDQDVVVVTGSRIARDPNLTEPLPVQSVDADAIRLSGELDLVDVINDIPALSTSTTTEGSIDGIFSGAVGGSRLNLRGLGAERTLVLVNGQRHVAGNPGTAIVDLNSIPSALVERVDVLTGGAS